MKIVISLAPLHSGSKTRGVGVYTKNLVKTLQTEYPEDQFILTTHSYYDPQADLVHLPFFDPFFLTLPNRFPLPTIATIHDVIPLLFPRFFPRGIKGSLKWRIQRQRARRLTHILTDSQVSKRDIQRVFTLPLEQITTVPLGPSLTPRKLSSPELINIKQKYNLPSQYFLYVGDLNWNKNVPGLIAGFASAAIPGQSLVIVGQAFTSASRIPERLAVDRAIRDSGMADQIRLLGYVPKDELSAIYQLANLYVQPSFYEGFGLPVLDALGHGCPVLSSDQGSLPEIGGQAVHYFDPNDPQALPKMIKQLIHDPAGLRKLARSGPPQAARFSWVKCARETHQVYEKIVAARL